MEFVFEDLGLEHQEDVIRILNYYIKETTSAYRENEVDKDFFLDLIHGTEYYCGFAIKNKEGSIVGFCTLEPYMSISTFLEVAEPMYFIDPKYTRLGIGTVILNKLENEARKRGVRKLLVDISSDNINSIKFHKKNGFAQCGMLQNIGKKFGRYFSVILMEKHIHS